MQLGQELDRWDAADSRPDVRGLPSPCLQTVLRLLPVLPCDAEAAPTRQGCVPGHQGHPGVREGTNEWLNPRSRVSVSSVPLVMVGAESELFSLTQLLGSWPGQPLQASGFRGWRQMSVCLLGRVYYGCFCVAASF